MVFRIHGTYPDGTKDSIVVEGESIEDVREQADAATSSRGWTNLWSERLSD